MVASENNPRWLMPEFPSNTREWLRCFLLVTAFVVPIQTLLPIKTFRLFVALLLAAAASAVWENRQTGWPAVLLWSFWLGLAGLFLSTVFSQNPLLSLDSGILEFVMPFACLSLFLAVSEDQQFMRRLVAVFLFSALLLSVAQATRILASSPEEFHLPVFASEFLKLKMNVPLMVQAGKFGYGNTDNYVSLWVLLVPAVAGYFFLIRNKWSVALPLLVLIYSGLLVYSRSGIAAIAIGLLTLLIQRLVIWRHLSIEIVAVCVAIAAVHVPPGSMDYFSKGATSLIESPELKQGRDSTSEQTSARGLNQTREEISKCSAQIQMAPRATSIVTPDFGLKPPGTRSPLRA